MPAPRRRDERGTAFPSPVVLLSVVAVAMAGVAFLATDGPGEEERVTVVSREADPTPSATPSATPTRTAEPARKAPAVRRGEVVVEVYNQSGISGLAGRVADRTADIGWQVVGSDNWVGTIPSSTVYFPPRLQKAADVLARDLGIDRVVPAVEPMRFDRLTVILTGEL
ncbi:LytR C-terminal domain-containing protein [Nocardioides perillae]|uniref:LytR/CpsA/Psr regulator C-terminal domain-containing protein n=1 Tax=Nocardioides perillae TaxID=1119534 RepID=A0A7Y9RR76_9ACTN|nr:hypothetical protein [Nocardioides perillae]